MKIYGNIDVKGSGDFRGDVRSDYRNSIRHLSSGLSVSKYAPLSDLKFELVGVSGSYAPSALRCDYLGVVNGRLFFTSHTPHNLYEIDPEYGTYTTIGEFTQGDFYGYTYYDMIVGAFNFYHGGTIYTSNVNLGNGYCMPFVWNGDLISFNDELAHRYNSATHKWERCEGTVFGGYDFANDDENVPSIRAGIAHNGKLYMISQNVSIRDKYFNGVYAVDNNGVYRVPGDPWTDGTIYGPSAIFILHGRLYIADMYGKIYELTYDEQFVERFTTPGTNGIFDNRHVYYGDGIIFRLQTDESAEQGYQVPSGIVWFDGLGFQSIGNYNEQFPGTTLEQFCVLDGYLYTIGGQHIVTGNTFVARVPISQLDQSQTMQNLMKHTLPALESALSYKIKSDLNDIIASTSPSGVEAIVIAASGDLYGDRGRGWELIANAWDGSERRPFDIVSWHGNLYVAGADTDSIYRVNPETKTVTDIATLAVDFGDFGRYNHQPIDSYLFGNADSWDGTTVYDVAINATNYKVRQYKNRIYFFDNDSPYRILYFNIVNKGWDDVSSQHAWDNIKSAAVWDMIECKGYAFLLYASATKTILKWNGDTNNPATIVYTAQASETPYLFVLDDHIYVWADGGTNDGKIYRFNWVTNQFVLYLTSGYSLAGGAHQSFAEKDGCMYASAIKISDSSRKLVRFNGANIQEITSMPNPEPHGDYLCCHNGALYLLIFDVNGYNQMYLYRYTKSLLGEPGMLRKDISDIRLQSHHQYAPPSGSLLPPIANYNYGDWYYLNASGNAFYRKGLNRWHLIG